MGGLTLAHFNKVAAILKDKKIAIFAMDKQFIEGVAKSLSQNNQVRYFEGNTPEQISNLTSWADVAWFEWCDDLFLAANRTPKQCRVICRLHSYEAFTNIPGRVDWGEVDFLVWVNKSVETIVRQKIDIRTPSAVIYNGVDLDRFTIPKDKTYGKKIASVGYLNYKKNPGLLLYCFKKIHERDRGYTFHIAGTHQDPRIALYFKHFLQTNPLPITFDGWVTDMPSWYADKDFVISTSFFESFHYSIAEGMACGLSPLIHDWFGADNLYPDECLFQDPNDCVDLLAKLETENPIEKGVKNRRHIMKRFDQKRQIQEIADLIESIV